MKSDKITENQRLFKPGFSEEKKAGNKQHQKPVRSFMLA